MGALRERGGPTAAMGVAPASLLNIEDGRNRGSYGRRIVGVGSGGSVGMVGMMEVGEGIAVG
jgi:hypothetical protein